eukprot:1714988-Ditylum_brightwellii.AAC.1
MVLGGQQTCMTCVLAKRWNSCLMANPLSEEELGAVHGQEELDMSNRSLAVVGPGILHTLLILILPTLGQLTALGGVGTEAHSDWIAALAVQDRSLY